MGNSEFKHGLQQVADGVYAYIQPDGSWGLNNAGLICGGDESLVVDTLYDLNLTAEMIKQMSKVTSRFTYLINTHANGDHCYGNQLVEGARIVSTKKTVEGIAKVPPQMMTGIMAGAKEMGPAGEYFEHCFGKFDFTGCNLTLPEEVFEDFMTLNVGGRKVELIEFKDCHTESDTVVYVPDAKVLFASDLIFQGVTPVMWAIPLTNWTNALDKILDMDVDIIVPGHGPVTDKKGLLGTKKYFDYITKEAKQRHEAGMEPFQAACDIELGEFAHWPDSERLAMNVDMLYRQFNKDTTPVNPVDMFGIMARYVKVKG